MSSANNNLAIGYIYLVFSSPIHESVGMTDDQFVIKKI